MIMSLKRSALVILVSLLSMAIAVAEEPQQDNTGTNPANFTYDFRVSGEYQSLPGGDNSLRFTTFEMRWPLGANIGLEKLGQRFQVRFKVPMLDLSVESPEGETFNRSGIGDINARLLWLAKMKKKYVLATGLEVFFDTASDESLGQGQTALGPQVFVVFPGMVGKGSIFAPAYQYVFDVSGNSDRSDISRSQIDLFFVWTLRGGKNWAVVDPQIIFDHENGTETALIEVEWGQMMGKSVSSYVRPGFHVASDELYDWNIEIGLKYIWR
jgi:hypothetical protein